MSKLASRALELFMQQRRLAESDNGQELSLDEINEEIRVVRKERNKKGMSIAADSSLKYEKFWKA